MISKCDFSLRHYFDVLDNAKNNYSFIGSFRDLEKAKKKDTFIVLRHDVDISLEQALKIAKAEAKTLCTKAEQSIPLFVLPPYL